MPLYLQTCQGIFVCHVRERGILIYAEVKYPGASTTDFCCFQMCVKAFLISLWGIETEHHLQALGRLPRAR